MFVLTCLFPLPSDISWFRSKASALFSPVFNSVQYNLINHNCLTKHQNSSAFLLGPKQVLTCEVPIVFQMTTFSSEWSHFSLPENAQKLTKLGIYVTKFHNLLLSPISTTRWHYNQGKCFLACNSHILCCTFKNLISTRSLNCAESRHIGHAHFRLPFFSQIRETSQTYFSVLLPGDFTDLRQTFAHSICGLSWQEFWYSKQYSSY